MNYRKLSIVLILLIVTTLVGSVFVPFEWLGAPLAAAALLGGLLLWSESKVGDAPSLKDELKLPDPPLYIYVAGPLHGSGDLADNIKNACLVGTGIMLAGHIPFIPHLNRLWAVHATAGPPFWMHWDLSWLERCDMLVRLPGLSPGSDIEVQYAEENGIPVYHLKDLDGDLFRWLSHNLPMSSVSFTNR